MVHVGLVSQLVLRSGCHSVQELLVGQEEGGTPNGPMTPPTPPHDSGVGSGYKVEGGEGWGENTHCTDTHGQETGSRGGFAVGGVLREVLPLLCGSLTRQEWKEHPTQKHSLVWCLRHLTHPHLGGPRLHLFLPPLLLFVDDYEVCGANTCTCKVKCSHAFSPPLPSTPLLSSPLPSPPLHSSPLPYPPLLSSPLPFPPLPSTPLPSTPLLSPPLPSPPLPVLAVQQDTCSPSSCSSAQECGELTLLLTPTQRYPTTSDRQCISPPLLSPPLLSPLLPFTSPSHPYYN